jgi:HEAT repeat protein
VPKLVAALKHEDPFIRGEALRMLLALEDKARPALPHMREALKDEDPAVRELAKGVLAELGEK